MNPDERRRGARRNSLMLRSHVAQGQPVDPQMLRPEVRSKAFLDSSPLLETVRNDETLLANPIPSATIAGNLHWVLADNAGILSAADVDETGLSFDQLFETALQNTATPAITSWAVLDDRIYSPVVHDGSLARAVLQPGGLSELPITGEVVAFLATHDLAVITSASDHQLIERAAALTTHYANSPHPLSLRGVVGKDGCWRNLTLPIEHPGFGVCRLLELLDEALAYGMQRGLLQLLLKDEIVVSPFEITDRADNPESVSFWTDTNANLLPTTDLVAFPRDEHGTIPTTTWDAMVEICGDKLEPTAHRPMRWRTVSNPEPFEIDAMVNLAQR